MKGSKEREVLREKSHLAQIRSEKWTAITLVVTALGVIDLFWPGFRGQLRTMVQSVVSRGETRAPAPSSDGLSTVVTLEGGRRVVHLYATNLPVAMQSLRRSGLSEASVSLSKAGEVRFRPRGAREWDALRALAARIASRPSDRILLEDRSPYVVLFLQ